ncbi:hypothetical protein PR048_014524 [Dryococelus australis]|uniref:Uncharacterized protein n=1 Tax=Dryococelus australis TaxID=614101 RepID=A0ABQ9HEP8_9NEOP|nr:hypothetical protein PR048_014524 [Dryococelus australis]
MRSKRCECGAALECKGGDNGRSPRKPAEQGASSGTILSCEGPGAALPGIEPGPLPIDLVDTVIFRVKTKSMFGRCCVQRSWVPRWFSGQTTRLPPDKVAPGTSHAGIELDDAAGRRFTRESPIPSALAFRRWTVLTSLHTNLLSSLPLYFSVCDRLDKVFILACMKRTCLVNRELILASRSQKKTVVFAIRRLPARFMAASSGVPGRRAFRPLRPLPRAVTLCSSAVVNEKLHTTAGNTTLRMRAFPSVSPPTALTLTQPLQPPLILPRDPVKLGARARALLIFDLQGIESSLWIPQHTRFSYEKGGGRRRGAGIPGWGETGDPRENPPTSGIVLHESLLRNPGRNPGRIETGSSWWKASSLNRPSSVLDSLRVVVGKCRCLLSIEVRVQVLALCCGSFSPPLCRMIPPGCLERVTRLQEASMCETIAKERVSDYHARFPSRRTGFPRPGDRIFASGNRAGRCRWSAGFLGDLPFPLPLHSGAAPYSLQSPS